MDEIFKKYFSYITKKDNVELTVYQKQLISYFLKKDNISIIKKRRVGFTTTIISYILFLIESNSNKKDITIIVPNNSTADLFMHYMSNYILNTYNISNFNISFSKNNIKIFDYNISINNNLRDDYGIRGITPDLLIIDEAEFVGEKRFAQLEFLFSIILARSGQVICSSSIGTLDKSKGFQKRHFKSLELSNIYTRKVILEKKQKKSFYEFEIPFSIDLREVF
jgi:hypothetical protein